MGPSCNCHAQDRFLGTLGAGAVKGQVCRSSPVSGASGCTKTSPECANGQHQRTQGLVRGGGGARAETKTCEAELESRGPSLVHPELPRHGRGPRAGHHSVLGEGSSLALPLTAERPGEAGRLTPVGRVWSPAL